MGVARQQFYCTFPKEQIREPILYNLGQHFQVIPNIRGASITDDLGLVCLELEGDQAEIDRAVDYLRERHVQIDTTPPEEGN